MLLGGANGAGAVRSVRVQKNSMKHKGKDNKNELIFAEIMVLLMCALT